MPAGCRWVEGTDPPQTLCDVCHAAESIAQQMVTVFKDIAESNAGGRLRLIGAAWDDLTLEHRRLLVMSCRQVLELVTEQLDAAMTESALAANVEISIITRFLAERCPHELAEGDGVSDVVVRLLEPHIGGRIVLPGGYPRVQP